jgi:hypothetical protein
MSSTHCQTLAKTSSSPCSKLDHNIKFTIRHMLLGPSRPNSLDPFLQHRTKSYQCCDAVGKDDLKAGPKVAADLIAERRHEWA